MTSFFNELRTGLVWLPELGMGRYPVPAERPYNHEYFVRYQQMSNTAMGYALTQARIHLVARHYQGQVLDVGIGAGQFVNERTDTLGFDINPVSIDWLKQQDKWSNLYDSDYPALTFWDSLEHIDEPAIAVARATQWVFVSIPIFTGAEHVLASKHYRKDEHIWYWTHDGFIRWFVEQGFTCVEHNRIESDLGREEIDSYAFKRVNALLPSSVSDER
jgi:hypothetical protein